MKKTIFLLLLISGQLISDTKVDSLISVAKKCYNTNIDSVEVNLKRAYVAASLNNDYKSRVEVVCELINYANNKVDLELGNKYFNEGLSICKENKYVKGEAKLNVCVSLLNENNGSYDQSIYHLVKALKIFDSINMINEKSNVYRLLSHVFLMKKDIQKSKEYAFKFMKTSLLTKDEVLIAQSYSYVANIFSEDNKYDSAAYYFKRSINSYKKIHDNYNLAVTYNNFGLACQKASLYNDAETQFLNSYNLAKKINYHTLEVYLEMELGCLYTDMKNYNKAEDFLMSALNKENQIKHAGLSYNLLYSIYNFYKETGNDSKALEFHEKFTSLSDSLNKINSDQRILEVETKFRTKEKQKEIEALDIENKLKSLEVDKKNQAVDYLVVIAAFTLLIVIVVGFGYIQKKKANGELQNKNKIIAEKNSEIMDSIHYAQKIQETILPRNVDDENKFIMFQPKDVVSGDFYWYKEAGERMYIAAADCTGHGVPGALMSIINNEILNAAIENHNLPCNILSHVNDNLLNRMAAFQRQDGMDIGLIMYDKSTKTLYYSGAKRPLYLVRNGVLTEYKGTKFSIGGNTPYGSEFEMNAIKVEEGDCFYVTTDGFCDQFGGTNNKKYSTKKFKEFLTTIFALTAGEQREALRNEIRFWKGNTEQTDDICVIGLKF